jgi:signal transduction histidine kinase
MMTRSKWFFHSIFIFIFSILALGTSLFLYIYWYIEVSAGLKSAIQRFNLDSGQVLASQTWVVILVLSILVGIILMGIFTIFVYNQKILQLYRMQRNFINNFTHELKTPVTSLKLYLETFLKHKLSKNDQSTYLGYMIQDVNRLADNINRILSLAKIESKSYEGEFVVVDLVPAIDHIYKSNIHLFSDCEINILNPSDRSLPCRINRSLFEMLVMNLLNNAIKYNDSKPPRVDITFELQHHKLYIRFRDNGIGLDESEIKKIFRKFYQVGQSDDMSAMGSGLGLYLVQTIARIHSGKVVAESKGSGKGSVFTLILPFRPRIASA